MGRPSVGVEDDSLGLLIPPDPGLPTSGCDGHLDRRARQLGVGVPAGRRAEEAPGVEVDHGGQVELGTTPVRTGRDLGDITDPLVRVLPHVSLRVRPDVSVLGELSPFLA